MPLVRDDYFIDLLLTLFVHDTADTKDVILTECKDSEKKRVLISSACALSHSKKKISDFTF